MALASVAVPAAAVVAPVVAPASCAGAQSAHAHSACAPEYGSTLGPAAEVAYLSAADGPPATPVRVAAGSPVLGFGPVGFSLAAVADASAPEVHAYTAAADVPPADHVLVAAISLVYVIVHCLYGGLLLFFFMCGRNLQKEKFEY